MAIARTPPPQPSSGSSLPPRPDYNKKILDTVNDMIAQDISNTPDSKALAADYALLQAIQQRTDYSGLPFSKLKNDPKVGPLVDNLLNALNGKAMVYDPETNRFDLPVYGQDHQEMTYQDLVNNPNEECTVEAPGGFTISGTGASFQSISVVPLTASAQNQAVLAAAALGKYLNTVLNSG